MQRRKFLQQGLAGAAGLMMAPLLSRADWLASRNAVAVAHTELEKFFLNPPDDARPWCFYMWMNGNITKKGITADLEAMKRMGIGGAICFNSAVGIPRGSVDYASAEWMDATAHAIQEAQRLGLVLAIHNSPGYSGCGGPWVTPEMSMQQLVWTETTITGASKKPIKLAAPYKKHGFYRDAFVIAYPATGSEKLASSNRIKSILLNGDAVDPNVLMDGSPETKIRLEATAEKPVHLLFEFFRPFEAKAITILRKPEVPHDLFDGPRDHQPLFTLESSTDNINFSPVCTLNMPALREMDTPGAASFNAVTAKYFRLTARSPTWISNVEFHASPRLPGWPGKLNYTGGSWAGGELKYQADECIDPDLVIDISDQMDASGNLRWNVPKGAWTILRIGHTTTGEEPAAHPDSGKGLEIDKLRKDALELHFDEFLDKLIDRVKPQIGSSFKGITVDSWEAGKQNWTAAFPDLFKEKRNYSLNKFIPALTGRIVGSTDQTERFLWDFRKTHADLLSENFYGHYHALCRERGLEFYAEPYGDGTFDSLQVAEHLDITMSEFWTRYIYGSDVTSKQAASAAHVYGKKIVAAEAFTAMPATSKWTDYPYSLKAEGDYFFSLGVNRLVFHTFVHQPFFSAKPGMTMGPFGAHFDRNNTWTEQAYGWTGYLQRAQFLLQQGLFVADVCYFKGDEPSSGVPDIYQFLPTGYAGDVINADGLGRLEIKDGLISLPLGMQYKVCILAKNEAVLPSTLTKIKKLVAQGMTLLVSAKPSRTLGQGSDKQIQDIAGEFYGELDGKNVRDVTFGKGKIIWDENFVEVFKKLNIEPDFSCQAENPDATIHYIHKKLPEMEYYFITNHRRRAERVNCSFRTGRPQVEIWNAETGEITPVLVRESRNGRTYITLDLDQAQAVFVVFRGKNVSTTIDKITRDGIAIYNAKQDQKPDLVNLSGITNNFSISFWIKPDSFAHANKSMVFHPGEGETLFGKGHSSVGFGAGQNGLFVYERTRGIAKMVLSASRPIEGWTYICLVYQDSCPWLYINGKFAKKGVPSLFTVHPGLNSPSAVSQFASYFEGNYTQPLLVPSVIPPVDIESGFKKGLPELMAPDRVDLLAEMDGRKKVRFWKNGKYIFYQDNAVKKTFEVSACKAIPLINPWQVCLDQDKKIILNETRSLHLHKDFDVRHFSGTANYQSEIELNGILPAQRQSFFLDLGRVEVLAEVKVNGISVGQVWKEPYRINVGKELVNGKNKIEIMVTTLWPNRLIGDEYLPEENVYSGHGFIEKLPSWFTENSPKPGKRKTFSVWKNINRADPLLESGLLGPVKILVTTDNPFDI
jgi:hypothetical protein